MEPNQNSQPPYQPPQPNDPQQWQQPQPAADQPQAFSPENQPAQQFAPQPAYSPATPAPVLENPGKTLGIISIVLIFFFPIAGIVLGAISRSKSKAANMPSGLGTAGLIINIVVLILQIIVGTLFFIFVIAAASESQNGSSSNGTSSFGSSSLSNNTASTLAADAKKVASLAESYKTQAGDYPKMKSDFSKYPSSTLPDDLYLNGAIYTNSSLTYVYCGQGSAQIVYLGDTTSDKKITALGSASSTEACPISY